MIRVIVAVMMFLFAQSSHAAIQYPCWVIKAFVEAKGEKAAIEWAKAQGWTDAEVAYEKRRCLNLTKGSSK
jgi:hypothetical protein